MATRSEFKWVVKIEFRDGTMSGPFAFDERPGVKIDETNTLNVCGKREGRLLHVVAPMAVLKVYGVREVDTRYISTNDGDAEQVGGHTH